MTSPELSIWRTVDGSDENLSVFFSLKTCLEDEMESYRYLLDGKSGMTTTARCISSTTTASKPRGSTPEIGTPNASPDQWHRIYIAHLPLSRPIP